MTPKIVFSVNNEEFTCSVVIIIDLIYLLGVTFEASPSENSTLLKISKKVDFGPKFWKIHFLDKNVDLKLLPVSSDPQFTYFYLIVESVWLPGHKNRVGQNHPSQNFSFWVLNEWKKIFFKIFQNVLEIFCDKKFEIFRAMVKIWTETVKPNRVGDAFLSGQFHRHVWPTLDFLVQQHDLWSHAMFHCPVRIHSRDKIVSILFSVSRLNIFHWPVK